MPKQKWRYHSENFNGNFHDAVDFINENHPDWDVVSLHHVTSTVTIIVWREVVSNG